MTDLQPIVPPAKFGGRNWSDLESGPPWQFRQELRYEDERRRELDMNC